MVIGSERMRPGQYLVRQQRQRWPPFTAAESAEGGRAGFIPFQLVMVGPLLVTVGSTAYSHRFGAGRAVSPTPGLRNAAQL